jgi:glycosyltransferase involved in cell wall biosynthesis
MKRPGIKSPSILISCSLAKTGGNETHVRELARLLSQAGYSVTVGSRSKDFIDQQRSFFDEAHIAYITTPLGSRSPSPLRNIWAALFWSRLRRAAFSHLIGIGPGGFHRLLKHYLREDGLAVYWESGDGTYHTPSHVRMLRAMDKLAATSSRVARVMQAYIDGEVHILPPLSSPALKVGPGSLPNRLPGQELRLAYLGRVTRRKGLENLIEGWTALAIGPARLDVYGGGDLLEELRRTVHLKGLSNVIHFHGAYERERDLEAILARTDLVVLPSEGEGLPHVLIEAMSFGVPFVATGVGGVEDLAHGNPDVLVTGAVWPDFAHGLETMARRVREGQVSRERLRETYQNHYAFERVSQQWLEFLGL